MAQPTDSSPGPTHPNARAMRARRIQLAVYWSLLAIGSHLPQFLIGENTNQVGDFQIDKTLHVIGFSGLCWLLDRARLAGQNAARFNHALAAAGIALGYALIDEYTQRFTGRNVALSDVVAGTIGILAVFLILTAPYAQPSANPVTRIMRYISWALVGCVLVVIVLIPHQPYQNRAGFFGLAAVLALLLVPSRPLGLSRPRWGVAFSIIAVGLFGPIIESARSRAGLDADMADLYAYQLGLLAALAVLALAAVVRNLAVRQHANA